MSEEKSSGKWHGGKGSAVRKTSNQNKYADNYDRIFGKKSAVDDAANVMSVYDDARLSTQTDEEAWGKNDKS